jgi:hypothetical protein
VYRASVLLFRSSFVLQAVLASKEVEQLLHSTRVWDVSTTQRDLIKQSLRQAASGTDCELGIGLGWAQHVSSDSAINHTVWYCCQCRVPG